MRNPSPAYLLPSALLLLGAFPTSAQFTSDLCPNVQLSASDFQATELFNKLGTAGAAKDPDLWEPVHFDVHSVFKNGKYDHSDILFVERAGNLKWYDGVAKKVSTIGTVQVHAQPGTEDDNGLMGVVFHPDFDKNRWIYLWYSPRQTFNQAMTGSGPYRQLRLSRFTLKDDNTLLDGSEKILLKLPASSTDRWHSGGPMVFDAYGDLWGTFGNNGYDLKQSSCDSGGSVLSKTSADSSAEWGSSDTHSLRGGFWRIHPDSSEKGYSIPSGNFGEYWADRFQQEGRATLAAQYRDTSKVLPEVYVKGERSNFSIAVHPTKRWLAWGTVNPASDNDEFTLTNHPIFSGFPYFMQNNVPTCNHGKDKNRPVNDSPFHRGVDTLPPAVPGNYNNLENVAIGGPIYSFDPSVDYDKKFPPHFNNTWLMGSFATNHLWMARIDGSGQEPKAPANPVRMDGTGLFKNFPVRNFLQAMYGKEGALYVLNYSGTAYHDANNPGLFRVEYNGACRVPVGLARKPQPPYQSILINPAGIAIREAGAHRVALFDVKGSQVWSASAAGPREYRLEAIRNRAGLRPGVYFARVTTAAGSVEATVSVF